MNRRSAAVAASQCDAATSLVFLAGEAARNVHRSVDRLRGSRLQYKFRSGEGRYRLTVRTDGSQPSNRGSIPRTATIRVGQATTPAAIVPSPASPTTRPDRPLRQHEADRLHEYFLIAARSHALTSNRENERSPLRGHNRSVRVVRSATFLDSSSSLFRSAYIEDLELRPIEFVVIHKELGDLPHLVGYLVKSRHDVLIRDGQLDEAMAARNQLSRRDILEDLRLHGNVVAARPYATIEMTNR